MTKPGSFIVSCSLSGVDLGCALCDLGANINLMPLSIFKKLETEEVQPTHADRYITKLEGKIENILVKVDKFLFPSDFVILNYEVDQEVPIILGRQFLSIGCTLKDVHQGELTMRLNNEKINFNVINGMKLPTDVESCSAIEVLD